MSHQGEVEGLKEAVRPTGLRERRRAERERDASFCGNWTHVKFLFLSLFHASPPPSSFFFPLSLVTGFPVDPELFAHVPELPGAFILIRPSLRTHEDFASGPPKTEFVEHYLPEESVNSESGSSCASKRNWASSLREAATAVSRVIGSRWTVPWTAATILQVKLLWIAAFWFIGSWMIPFAAHIAGFNKETLTFRGQAFLSLITDVPEGIAGIAILHHWFRFSLRGNWHIDLVLGCFMLPLVNRLSQLNLNLLPVLPSMPVTLSSVEQSILARDPVAMALYAVVVSICAPVWEEIVFRGFVLPSLTKYMPVWCAILVSSVIFVLAHFNVQRMLPLIFLGAVMGVIFTRSRNLLPSMLLHSLWNGFVFLDLMK